MSKLSKLLTESSAKLHRTPVPWQRFSSFTNVKPKLFSSHKKIGWYTKLVLEMRFWFLKSSKFNQRGGMIFFTNFGSQFTQCQMDGLTVDRWMGKLWFFVDWSCLKWTSPTCFFLLRFRVSEIRMMGELRKSIICFLRAPSVPRTITVPRDAHAGP